MKKTGWKTKVRRGLAAACLTVGLFMASWNGPGVNKAEAGMMLPVASYSGTVTPNHDLKHVYVGFSYYFLNTSGDNAEVFHVADSISAGSTVEFSGYLSGGGYDIDWNQPVEYVVLGVYDEDNRLVTVGFDTDYDAIGKSWTDVFGSSCTNCSESDIADALINGDIEDLALFIIPRYEGVEWADIGEGSNLVKFSNGTEGGTAYASATPMSAVPIPGAAWLLGSGLIGLVLAQRRKTKA